MQLFRSSYMNCRGSWQRNLEENTKNETLKVEYVKEEDYLDQNYTGKCIQYTFVTTKTERKYGMME